jgi:hypothetical protein
MRKVKIYAAAAVLAGGILFVAPMSSATATVGKPVVDPKPPPAVAPQSQVTGSPVAVPPRGRGIASVSCPAGTLVTGGGGQTSGFDIFFTDSFASGNGWTIRGTNTGTVTQNLTAVAICIG